MKVAVIYESRTGNTARVARMIGAAAEELGAEVGVWSTSRVNLDFLSDADLVFVGTWTDGVIIAGHRPGDSRRLKVMPGLWGRPTAGFVTYAIHAGNVLDKLERVQPWIIRQEEPPEKDRLLRIAETVPFSAFWTPVTTPRAGSSCVVSSFAL